MQAIAATILADHPDAATLVLEERRPGRDTGWAPNKVLGADGSIVIDYGDRVIHELRDTMADGDYALPAAADIDNGHAPWYITAGYDAYAYGRFAKLNLRAAAEKVPAEHRGAWLEATD